MSGLACCWPPSLDTGSGALEIGLSPVVGGLPGEFLKVGPGGLLDQSALPTPAIVIGAPVSGGVAGDVLFVGATGLLAQAAGFRFDAAAQNFSIPGRWLVRADQETVDWRGSGGAVHLITNVHTEANGFGDPEPCQVYEWGWNFDGIDPLYGGWDFTCRSYLRLGADGTQYDKVQTWALQHVTAAPTLIHDVISVIANQRTGFVHLALGADELLWSLPGNPAALGQLGNDVTINVGGVHCITYGARALQQNNSAGTNSERLVMLTTSSLDATLNVLELAAGENIARVEVLKNVALNAALHLNAVDALSGVYFADGATGNVAQTANFTMDAGASRLNIPKYLNTPGEMVLQTGTVDNVKVTGNGINILPGGWLQMPKTAIVPLGALARFKFMDETGAVFYVTGQAA
jgi:hypothetical protein